MDIKYYGMDVPTLSLCLRPILTVTFVRNTGETSDIYHSIILTEFFFNVGSLSGLPLFEHLIVSNIHRASPLFLYAYAALQLIHPYNTQYTHPWSDKFISTYFQEFFISTQVGFDPPE